MGSVSRSFIRTQNVTAHGARQAGGRAGGDGGELMFSSLTGREVRLTAWRNGALEKTSVPTAHKSSYVQYVRARTPTLTLRLTAAVPPMNSRCRLGSECSRSSQRFHRTKCLTQYFKGFRVFRKNFEFSERKSETIPPTRGHTTTTTRGKNSQNSCGKT